eukprot:5585094-Karenia_brevis.AAC.1
MMMMMMMMMIVDDDDDDDHHDDDCLMSLHAELGDTMWMVAQAGKTARIPLFAQQKGLQLKHS